MMFTDFLTLIEVGEVLGVRFEKAGLIVAARNEKSFFTPGTRCGVFENIAFNLLDRCALTAIEENQETIGIPDGMGTRPYNIHKYEWERLKGRKYVGQHNYFVPSVTLLQFYRKAAVKLIVNWPDFYQKSPEDFVDALSIVQRNDMLLKHVYNSIEDIDNYLLPMWERIEGKHGL
ncbi:MAG: hypothetical protein ACE5OZ_22230 [Candidatus Heimdallarchaeota archaeon]